MKRILIGLLTVFALAQTFSTWAQEPVTTLDQLNVDIWPDYDRPEVLVLLTGTLPSDAPFPATITIPIPLEVDVNAVARIDIAGDMYADIEFDDSVPGQLTLTTPEPRFRIEYYYPYVADGDDRTFAFSWQSNLIVDEFLVNVQQPIHADELTLSPPASSVTTGGDGMNYHDLSATAVGAGEVFELEGSYNLSRPQLSVDSLSAQEVPLVGAGASGSEAVDGESDFNLLLAAGVMIGVLILAAVGWLVYSNRAKGGRVFKPRPVRQDRTSAPKPTVLEKQRFCHECGQPIDADDRFCSNCGAAVKKTS